MSRWDGPLRPEMAAASTRLRLEPFRRIRVAIRMAFPRSRLANRVDELAAFFTLAWLKPDLVYANTVKSACFLRPAIRLGIPAILHVHELEPMASATLDRYHLGPSYNGVHLVACSNQVAANLAVQTGVDESQIDVLRSLIDVERVVERAQSNITDETSAVNQSTLVVGAVAMANERKGVDLWLRAAAKIHTEMPSTPVRFRWVGRYDESHLELARELDVIDSVEFVGEQENPFVLMAAMDIFTLPSRGDPFPLVVLEAMALGRPIVAFDVDGVPEQLGDAGVLVPPQDVSAFASAIVELIGDASQRSRLGRAAAKRVRKEFGIERFRTAVVEIVAGVANTGGTRMSKTLRLDPRGHDKPTRHAFLLQSFDTSALAAFRATSGHPLLPLRADTLTDQGFALELTDADRLPPWTSGPVSGVVRFLEGLTTPFLQTLLASRAIKDSDVTLAAFESQGNALAVLRSLRVPPFTRPRFAILACWLARDLGRFGRLRRLVYSLSYRSVDRLIFFSANQAAIFESELKMPGSKLCSVTFGVDHEFFAPADVEESDYILSVGRDAGRDWETLLDAVRGTEMRLRIASRPEAFAALDVPDNVELLGFVDRNQYRELLGGARVVAVITQPLNYPTGQSVALEAMAMRKCTVVTDTEPMREYVRDEDNALLVPPGDPEALRSQLRRALGDDDLRSRIGEGGRRSVEQQFNAPMMWRQIAEVLREACTIS